MNQKINLIDDHWCFACGLENPDGLRLTWHVDGHTMTTTMIPEKKYQGWKGLLHGGILATLLDEAMTRLASIICRGALTAEMTVRYLKPAYIGNQLYVRGEIIKESRRIIEMRAFIHSENQAGPVIAYSHGKAIKKII